MEYLYNPDTTLRRLNTNKWDVWEEDWVPNFYRAYEYDTNKILQAETGFEYDYINDTSTKKFEVRYVSDSLGNILEMVEYIPGWEKDNFVPNKKQEYTYDLLKRRASEALYEYDYDADGWLGLFKQKFSHEPMGEPLHQINSYYWNSEDSDWKDFMRLDFLSNDQIESDELEKWQFLETYMPVYAFDGIVCDKIQYFISVDGVWNEGHFIDYYFSDKIVNVNEPVVAKAKIYPNPVRDILNIETNTFESLLCTIRNINGQLVIQKNIDSKDQINLSNLTPGFYFVELQEENQQIYSGKLIKR